MGTLKSETVKYHKPIKRVPLMLVTLLNLECLLLISFKKCKNNLSKNLESLLCKNNDKIPLIAFLSKAN
jgi:hypothetical protein